MQLYLIAVFITLLVMIYLDREMQKLPDFPFPNFIAHLLAHSSKKTTLVNLKIIFGSVPNASFVWPNCSRRRGGGITPPVLTVAEPVDCRWME